MSQPQIKTDIEARVKDTGDTMTGSLIIQNSDSDTSAAIFSQNNMGILQAYKNNNWEQRRTLVINTKELAPTLNNALVLGVLDDGTWKEYNILHTGNKKLLQYLTYGTDREYINEEADLNNYLTIGSYKCSANAIAKTLKNCPTEMAFILDIVAATGTEESISPSRWSYITQRLYTCMYNKIYVRSINSDPNTNTIKYGEWEEIIKSNSTLFLSKENYSDPVFNFSKTIGSQTQNEYDFNSFSPGIIKYVWGGYIKNSPWTAGTNHYGTMLSLGNTTDYTLQLLLDNLDDTFYFRRSTHGTWGNWNIILDNTNFQNYALPIQGGTMNGILYTDGIRMKTTTITVNGDLNTYYPVCIKTTMPNTEGITIYVSKALGTTSPAWSGNHSNGTSSCLAGYYLRNNGWDGNGVFCYNISPPYQGYAKIIGHAELKEMAAAHLVLWLRGGGAEYTICGSIPINVNVYLNETNLGTTAHPNTVAPMTTTGNLGWYNKETPVLSTRGGTVNGTITATAVYGAVWNDYAEYRNAELIEPGRVVIEHESREMKLSTERLQPGAEVISDTFGFAIGETEECKTPIATSGRVLAYPNEDRNSYPLGAAVCSGPNGTVSLMTREEIREYPERIIGTVSEIPNYETWGTGEVKVNGRIWIRIK